ncbi:MAG: glucosidase, partial [Daejeonella sp.]
MLEEQNRINELNSAKKNWHLWGCYLSERQWGTVREDYSENGDAWKYLTHNNSRSRAYRWGEDGIAGISDENQNLCFAISMWNGKDPILKERLFGLNNFEGNHGEDVKELYYYLENTPTHSYMRYLYKYPIAEFPYDQLLNENKKRGKDQPEFEITDSNIFDGNNYFDIEIEYAKADFDDILIRITVSNRSENAASIKLLPVLWFRNTWDFGLTDSKPQLSLKNGNRILCSHPSLSDYNLHFQQAERVLFTENESNAKVLWNVENQNPFKKDAFHNAVIDSDFGIFADKCEGTKASPVYSIELLSSESRTIKLRLSRQEFENPFHTSFDDIFTKRIAEANEFYKQ